jgi:putative SOS response-associated peptidase YedK
MCYKVSTPPKHELEEIARRNSPQLEILDYPMYYNAVSFARPYLPVQLNTSPEVIRPAVWTLVPSFVKDVSEWKTNTANARSEEVFETKSYKPYIKKYRGLLWVSGFYEPHTIYGETKSKNLKQHYYIYQESHEPFTMGVVWSPNYDKGVQVPTFSIITTDANELLAQIHNEGVRMPLIIPPDKRAAWLGELDEIGIKELMKPLPDGILKAHPVDIAINNTKLNTNYQEIQLPVPLLGSK